MTSLRGAKDYLGLFSVYVHLSSVLSLSVQICFKLGALVSRSMLNQGITDIYKVKRQGNDAFVFHIEAFTQKKS